MRKTVSVFASALLCLAAVFLLASCGGANSMSPEEIAGYIIENVELADLIETDRNKIFTSFLNVGENMIKDVKVFVSGSEEKADELIVVRLYSEKDFDPVLRELNAHINARAESFAKQSSAESAKLQNVVIRRTDSCIILVVCEQYKKAAEVLDELKTREIK